ncbi:SGNH/GDSL hydrolase family protein [Microbacterium album]|uniref:SGNH hydrolase-type esterase domain-containing protein n=1 Tax=Microbacterium album TaxID=2053191 RepID=A0A917MPT3_9MICO|nr:SGNH/GDSL hydrolase family protein [Microbacterium album]GGH48919.1 hypothetical protein GCM10010921_26740 [Microbacterium album]
MSRAPIPRRVVAVLLVAAVVAVGAAVLAGALRPWAAPVAEVERAAAADPAPVLEPAPLALPEEPDVLVLGDSWTYGSAATPLELGYAYVLADLLGGRTHVDGVRGSGYVRPGVPTFGERIAELDPEARYDLIVVQGSINDRREPAEGYPDAVTAAWDALAALYPETPVVVLGPAPQVLPVEEATARIDADLASLAQTRGWWYISPLREEWITEDNYRTVIDTSETGANHPSVAGHAYLAERLAQSLAEIVDPATRLEAADDPEAPGSL